MKKITTFLIFCMSIFNTFAQSTQAPIIVTDSLGNGSTTVSNIGEALQKVPTNGFIYLPGGTFDAINIDKKVNIRGAGIDSKASFATGLTVIPIMNILIGGSGSTVEGVVLTQYITFNQSTDITLTRCNIAQLTVNNNSISILTVHNCLVQSISGSAGASNITITNCFVKDMIGGYNNRGSFPQGLGNNIRIENCILYHKTISQPNVNDGNGEGLIFNQGTYKNNIVIVENYITADPSVQLSPNVGAMQIMSNNFFTTHLLSPIDSRITNNQFKALNTGDIFVDWANRDYRLKPTFAYRLSGENGTEIGIFGGSNPGRDGFIPSAPYIYFKEISNKPDAQGNLQIKIKVKSPD